MPTISVIVPVFNVETYLNRCIDSILNQTYKDFELILVNDGSSDNCPSICDQYANLDERVVVIHKNNGGLSSARNAGLDYSFNHSNSKYITFVDSDDWLDVNFLQYLHSIITEYKVDVAMCGTCLTSIDVLLCTAPLNKNDNYYFDGSELVNVYYEQSIYFTAWGKVFDKQSLLNIRFKEGIIHEDEYFANDYYSRNVKCLYNPIKLYYYYVGNKNSITHTLSREDYLFEADSMLHRYSLIKKKIFCGNDLSIEKLLNSIYGFSLKYYHSHPPKKTFLCLSFRIAYEFPNKKKHLKQKIIIILLSFFNLLVFKFERHK